MDHASQITLELRSNPLYLCGARELVASVARRLGFSDETGGQLALAVDEALTNVIRHGYEGRSDGRIWLRIRMLVPNGQGDLVPGAPQGADSASQLGVEALELVIEDEAKQVDPSSIKSRDLDNVRPGGLGVHIIREVMDEVSYAKRENGAGMRLTMRKTRTDDGGEGATPATDKYGKRRGRCGPDCEECGDVTT